MAKYDKPEVPNVIWASNALDIDVEKPTDDEIRIGWEQEKPPYQVENWSMRKLHMAVAYFNQHGLAEWDKDTEYQQDRSYVQASDGRIYRAIKTNRNRNPADETNPEFWEPFRGDRLATTERTGVVELATVAEVAAGIRDDVVVTPHTLGEGYVGNPVGTIITFAGSNAPGGYMECDGRAISRSQYSELFSVIGTTYGAGNGSTTFNIPDTRGEFIRGWDHGRGADAGRRMGSYQSDLLQSHNHSGSTAYAGNHSHSAYSGQAGSHTHSGYTSTDGWHGHTGSTNTAGNHRHNTNVLIDSGDHSHYGESVRGDGDNLPNYYHTDYAGSHSHSLHINGNGSHNHTVATYASGNHTHSVGVRAAGNHNHSFSTSYTGGGETRPRNVAMMYCIKVE